MKSSHSSRTPPLPREPSPPNGSTSGSLTCSSLNIECSGCALHGEEQEEANLVSRILPHTQAHRSTLTGCARKKPTRWNGEEEDEACPYHLYLVSQLWWVRRRGCQRPTWQCRSASRCFDSTIPGVLLLLCWTPGHAALKDTRSKGNL
jgi:hypothetical protein